MDIEPMFDKPLPFTHAVRVCCGKHAGSLRLEELKCAWRVHIWQQRGKKRKISKLFFHTFFFFCALHRAEQHSFTV